MSKMLRESLYSIDYKDLRIIGISIHYSGCSDKLLISDKSINCIKVFDSTLGNNRIIGNMVININKVKFGNYTLDFLNNYLHLYLLLFHYLFVHNHLHLMHIHVLMYLLYMYFLFLHLLYMHYLLYLILENLV